MRALVQAATQRVLGTLSPATPQPHPPLLIAVAYVPPRDYEQAAAECIEYCQEVRYSFAGLIRGDWDAAVSMIEDGQAHVIVVAYASHLPAGRLPRVEVVAEVRDAARNADPRTRNARRRPRPMRHG